VFTPGTFFVGIGGGLNCRVDPGLYGTGGARGEPGAIDTGDIDNGGVFVCWGTGGIGLLGTCLEAGLEGAGGLAGTGGLEAVGFDGTGGRGLEGGGGDG